MTLLTLLLAACSAPPEQPPASQEPTDPVVERVDDAALRLEASEGGRRLHQIIEAHGGLERWYRANTLTFDFNYLPTGRPERRMYTRNQVLLGPVHVHQTELGPDADATFAWDGEQSWIRPSADSFPAPAAFWATTPYYFVGMPFVLADPGTNHHLDGDVLLTDPMGGERATVAVRVTFDDGTGQAPDDYYVVHADPQTHEMVALRYIVTDPAVRGPDSPPPRETILFYREPTTVDGLVLATHYDGYHWRDGAPATSKSTVDIDNIALGDPIDEDLFTAP